MADIGVALGDEPVGLGSQLFEVAAASVVGPSHQARDEVCQDHFAVACGPDWVVAVVSDGAGSAVRAREGAEVVSEQVSRSLARFLTLADRLSKRSLQTDRSALMGVLEAAIENARQQCLGMAENGQKLRSFHATLVGAVVLSHSGFFFHIGDGGASAHRITADNLETMGFSVPENGEYANETYFFTEDRWREHLRITEIQEPPDAVWLMTDGAYHLMVPRQQLQLRLATVKEINRLVSESSVEARNDVLAAVLSSAQAASRSDDDKTLVVIQRRSVHEFGPLKQYLNSQKTELRLSR